MIEFKWNRYNKNDNPIIKDVEIEELAQILVKDYKDSLLKEPGKINAYHFLESYLGATIEFKYIYYGQYEEPIWGMVAFNNGDVLKIFDRENLCTRLIELKEKTVVIDLDITEGKEGLELFTCLHEGGHLWMHPRVFRRNEDQLSLFDMEEKKSVICCRRENIEGYGKKNGLSTDEYFREHQANVFAAAIAMPLPMFRYAASNILKEAGIKEGRIVLGVDSDYDMFAEWVFPGKIAEIFGVSKKAAEIKLKKFGYIIDRETYERELEQVRLI